MAAKRFVVTLELVVTAENWNTANEFGEIMAGYVYRYDMNKIDSSEVVEVTELD